MDGASCTRKSKPSVRYGKEENAAPFIHVAFVCVASSVRSLRECLSHHEAKGYEHHTRFHTDLPARRHE